MVAKHKAIASYQRWRAAIDYQQVQKDFLKSLDPLKEVVYPELPPLDIPGAEEIKEGQLELF